MYTQNGEAIQRRSPGDKLNFIVALCRRRYVIILGANTERPFSSPAGEETSFFANIQQCGRRKLKITL